MTVLARTYGKALILSGKPLEALREMSESIFKNKKTVSFFFSPKVSQAEKEQVVKKAFPKELASVLCLLIKKNRLKLLPEIVDFLEKEQEKKDNQMKGVCFFSKAFTAEQKTKLEKLLSKHFKKKVVLEYRENKKLLTGYVVKIAGFIFEDHLEKHIGQLIKKIKGA